MVITVGDVVRSITVNIPSSTTNVTYSSPATAHPFTFTNTGTQLQFVAVGGGADELHSGNTFTINFSSCITTSTFEFTVNTYGNFDFTTSRTITGSQPTVSAKLVIPGGPDHICQLTTPSAFTLTGASFAGAVTAAWSITSLNPANGGANGTLSSTAQTNTPGNVTYTPPANYEGTITLTLTTDATGPCGVVSSTRTITVNLFPTITGTTPGVRCGIGTVTLGATASAGVINWYSASTGGTSLGTGTSFVTPSLSSTTTYYVDATANGCTTSTRTAVIATIAGASDTWIGGTSGFETDWNTALNWSCGVPTSTTDVTIPNGLTYYPVIGSANGFCRSITDMGGGSISGINGGYLTIAGNGGVAIANISGTATISCPVIMPADASVTIAGSLTISGVISGAGTSLTLNGSLTSTLTLSGSNIYTGSTTLTGGSLYISNDHALGTATGGTTLKDAAVGLYLSGGITVSGELLTIETTALATSGDGTETWAGNINIPAGTSPTFYSYSNNGALRITGNIAFQGSNVNTNFILGGTSNNDLNEISGIISGTGYIRKINPFLHWTLSGNNTFSGGTDNYSIVGVGVISDAGTLNINSAAALGASGDIFHLNGAGGALTIDNRSGAAIATNNYPILFGTNHLIFQGSNNLNLGTGAVTLQTSPTVTVNNNTLTIGGIIGGAFGLSKDGAGTLLLSGVNTYSGSTTVNAGILQIGVANSISTSSNFILNGGTFSTGSATGYSDQVGTIALTGNFTIALGTGSHQLKFADSHLTTWTIGQILTINGWQGSWNGTAGTAGQIFSGNTSTGLTTTQLDQIQFFDGTYYFPATILSTGEIVPGFRTITTGTISGSPFCAGVTGIQVPFTYRRFNSFPAGTTTFTAQLSNASGSFTTPVTLQSVASNASGSQSISITIPLATPGGNGYRIRVISNTPAITGSDNGVNLVIYAAITAGISGGTSPICYNTAPGTYTATGGGGTGSYTYQWYSTSGIISGATNQTYSPGNITATTGYYCAITSGSCGTVNTSTTTITVYANLNASISGGTSPICYNTSPGTFTATGGGGTGSYTYQWYSTSGIISGATNQTYSPGNITASTGYYCAVTSSSCGTVNTSTINITVNSNLTISGMLTLCAGSTTQLTGSGTPASSNPWVSGTTTIATVDNSGLVTGISAGTSVITYRDINGCTSNATITVSALPVITTQPINELDCEGHIVSFNVVATGSGLTYTWQRKYPSGTFANIPLTGEPNVSYPSPGTIRLQNVGNSDAPDGTQYQVVITDSNNCTITSNPATLTVNEITGINPITTNVTICQGGNYSYTVTVNYPSNVVSYHWKKWNNPGQWDNVIDGGAVSGATTNQLVFTGATPAESGQYKVTVVFHSSGADCNVTSDSRNRTLTVNPTPSCSISGNSSVFAGSTNNLFTSTPNPSDNVTHSWGISGNGTIVGSLTGITVSVNAAGAGTFTLTDNISRYSCTSSCAYLVTVVVPCSISPVTASVPNGTSTTYTAPAGMDTYSWSISGNGSITSVTNQQTVTVLAGNGCDAYVLTLALTISGSATNCSQTVNVTDNQPPTFTPPTAISECVESLNNAIYNSTNVYRPEYFTYSPTGNNMLDLTGLSDNCCTSGTLLISWRIDFSGGTPASITGTGQPSTYGSLIQFPGDGTTFLNMTHTITYWVTDCNGNVSPTQTSTITIKPRPNVIKQN